VVTDRLLVVGASYAGVQIAATARELGFAGQVTVLGDERRLPYQRPPLSKGFLAADGAPTTLTYLRDQAFFDRRQIELVCGEEVVDIVLDQDGRGTARTPQRREIDFDRLALAVGAEPRRLDVPGADLEGIHYLRNADDAAAIATGLRDARCVVVVGGGFLGLEIAASARSLGKVVVVLEAADRLLARTNGEQISDFFRQAHTRRQTVVRTSVQARAFDGQEGRVTGVELSDGSRQPADLVVVAIGVMPRIALAEKLGLRCAGGVVVSPCGQTSHPSVVAAGDCAVTASAHDGSLIRLESVQNATDQARMAAASLVNQPSTVRFVPWFWSQQYDLKLQTVGLARDYDRVVVNGNPDDEQFSVHYFRGDVLVAADCVNRPQEFMSLRRQWAARA
jgi:3-phenylpropionate/trans-cinnamate dioxygenase ferredoxin reductase subunit